MARIILGRIALAVPVFFIMTMLTFFLASLVPGDAATTILGENATPERVAQLNEELGFNRPIFVQYLDWLGGVFRGDLGVSLYTGEPVARTLSQRIVPTLSLAILSTLFASVVGVALGVVAAVRKGWAARVVDTISMLGVSLPNFWVGLLLITLFAGTLGWLPSVGYVAPQTSVSEWLLHLVMPVMALSFAGLALIARQARETMSEALSRDFMRFLQANGVPRRTLIYKYGLRYSAIPILSAISATFITQTAGTVVLESVFAIPGMGSLVARATLNHDLAVLQGAVLMFTIIILIANVLTDVLYSLLNPKVTALA
ncbi:ABC transporter permease [Microbacterium sp. ET2]|uniref:ABC transporter permease n=1 Tax=Microbacterium albipurpureum TaxID=3050384 RepID=UPI00259D1C80|nr:ABC transporter permease [Microbacterium sp. ET2 (Ac-2212)]WJL96763.1 ABC transporter permease [Microbacterium sp. ET2 (Ac-2212)]